jgi:hypothetical protein
MALLSSIINIRELSVLNERQLDILVAALDAELLTNAAVKKAVAGKIQTVHKGLAAQTTNKETKG